MSLSSIRYAPPQSNQRSLFMRLWFIFWQLYYLSYGLRLMITPLIFYNCHMWPFSNWWRVWHSYNGHYFKLKNPNVTCSMSSIVIIMKWVVQSNVIPMSVRSRFIHCHIPSYFCLTSILANVSCISRRRPSSTISAKNIPRCGWGVTTWTVTEKICRVCLVRKIRNWNGYNVPNLYWNSQNRSLTHREHGTLHTRYTLWCTVVLHYTLKTPNRDGAAIWGRSLCWYLWTVANIQFPYSIRFYKQSWRNENTTIWNISDPFFSQMLRKFDF